MVTKKQFIALADAIREQNKVGQPFTLAQLTKLGAWCQRENPRFNWDRWINYIYGKCGPNGGKIKTPSAPKLTRKEIYQRWLQRSPQLATDTAEAEAEQLAAKLARW